MRTRVGNVMSESSRLHATPASLSTGCICKSKNIAGCLFTLGILSLHRRITSVDFGGQDIFARKCMYARILLDIWPKNIFPILGGGGANAICHLCPCLLRLSLDRLAFALPCDGFKDITLYQFECCLLGLAFWQHRAMINAILGL